MSRNPINVELRALKTPRERIWEAILQLDGGKGGHFDKSALQDHCNPMVSWSMVDDYLDDLESGGFLKRVGGTGATKGVLGTPIVFALASPKKRQGSAPRVSVVGEKVTQGEGNEAMWRAMKVLRTFDYTDIAKAATLGDLVVKPSTAKSYVSHMARAGYLATVRASKPGTPAKHRLAKNTGPHAPAITRLKVVFDRNTGEFANLQTAQEVCDGLE
jgi:hypothetical protein